ncbi:MULTISPECIES: glycosyltransferase family protein [unclassified Sphingopyxis]|jgi:spore coat polysaccharide biosynthesis protein SpsF (cytidylyltransferase family)|uniref:glycosyltransferase family protein n=1 Tax=unclassified Sphingopyxis TaxID=2614943 RepID=UPI0024AE54CC|nr:MULTISPECIES: glycosyltransferase family protein [unclassified Sphingopyxis]
MSDTVALIQARMSSSRLPGKVLADLGGLPMICFMADRVRRARGIDLVAVLTSDDPSDDPLAAAAEAHGVPVVRGPLNDVLARYVVGADVFDARTILRLTGDCPLIDPALIAQVVALHRSAGVDYASNVDPPGFADGMDTECFTRDLLDRADRLAVSGPEREHVTLWMRAPESGASRANLTAAVPASHLRLTVDYPDDLALVRRIVGALGGECDYFDILRLLQQDAGLLEANPHERNEALKS